MRTRPWNRTPVGIVVFLCSTFVVRANETEAPAGTRSLGPLPFQLTLPREHLLGDWYGTRTWLEDHGITPILTFVTDSLGNPTGGTEQGFTTANNLGLDLNFDLEKLGVLEGGSVLFSMSYRFGGSLSANYIHNVFTVQQVFGGETFRVVNIAYLQKLLDDRVELRLGRIASVGADGQPVLSHVAAVAGLVAANLYIAAFGVSWGPVMWVLLGEMFPNQLRGAALAVSGATNWIANFAVTVTFLPLLKAIGLAGRVLILRGSCSDFVPLRLGCCA
jgi:hypothetical protein